MFGLNRFQKRRNNHSGVHRRYGVLFMAAKIKDVGVTQDIQIYSTNSHCEVGVNRKSFYGLEPRTKTSWIIFLYSQTIYIHQCLLKSE